jgi:hypothetical protein
MHCRWATTTSPPTTPRCGHRFQPMVMSFSTPFFCEPCRHTSVQLWRTELSFLPRSSPPPPPRCNTLFLPKLLLQPPHCFPPHRRLLSVQLQHIVTAARLAAQWPLVAARRRLIATDLPAATIAAPQRNLQAATSAGITRSSTAKLAAVTPSTVTGKTSSGSGGNPHHLPVIADRSCRRHFSSPHLPHGRAHQHPLPSRYWSSSQPHPLQFYISTIRTYNSQC